VLGNAIATSVVTKWEGMLEVEESDYVEHPKAPSHTPSHGRAGLELASDMVESHMSADDGRSPASTMTPGDKS